MASNQSGIFYVHHGSAPIGNFPKEFRKGLFSRVDSRFVIIFSSFLLVACALVLVLSIVIKVKTEVSDKEILKIQERYAQLVLNQPNPKPVEQPEENVGKGTETATETASKDEGKEEIKVDREKESFVQREERRTAQTEERAAIREQVARQVQTTGIFAAITASGSGRGGGSGAADLLGSASDGLADLGAMNISKGTFATKSVDAAELAKPKGTRTTNVGIQKSDVGSVAMTQVASSGAVNITSAPPEITGESASQPDRSQAAIGRVVNREQLRLKRVYEDWLKRDPTLSGRLEVKFTILPSGSVVNASIVKSTTKNPDFDDSVLRYIKRWQFPPVAGGGEVEVVYPFVFEGQA